MLAPVTVAAELLDDGSDTAMLLQRSAQRLRRASECIGDFIHLEQPLLAAMPASELLATLGTLITHDADQTMTAEVCVEPRRLSGAITALRSAIGATALGASIQVTALPDREPCPVLHLTLANPTASATPADVSLLGVPFALADVDSRVALACREIHLQDGGVRVCDDRWDVCLPITTVEHHGIKR
jgi:hypothetical protein